MKPPTIVDPVLAALLAKAAPMTEEERRRQAVSFVYGNLKLSGWPGKRKMVEAVIRMSPK